MRDIASHTRRVRRQHQTQKRPRATGQSMLSDASDNAASTIVVSPIVA